MLNHWRRRKKISLGATFLQKRFAEDGLLKKKCFDFSFIGNTSSKYPFFEEVIFTRRFFKRDPKNSFGTTFQKNGLKSTEEEEENVLRGNIFTEKVLRRRPFKERMFRLLFHRKRFLEVPFFEQEGLQDHFFKRDPEYSFGANFSKKWPQKYSFF